MGVNCTICINSKISHSGISIDIKQFETNYTNQIIKIQSTFRGHNFRKKSSSTSPYHKSQTPLKNLLTKTPYIITENSKISESQIENLLKTYPPLNDNIELKFIRLSFPNIGEYHGEMTCLLYECGTLIFIWGTLFYAIKFGLYLIKGNELNVNTFVSFFMLCKNILDNFNDLAYNMRNFLKAEIFTEKIFFVLDYEPKIKSFEPKIIEKMGIEKKISGKITIKNIFFEYPKENMNEIVTVLKNITLDIYPGMKLGIVGFSGSGKTTLINLIQRLYDVGFCERKADFKILKKISKEEEDEEKQEEAKENSGNVKSEKKASKKNNEQIKYKNRQETINDNCEILFDDINIKKYNLNCLHSQIGYVPQEPSLFDGTIKENLIYGLFEEETKENQNKYEKEISLSLQLSQADFVFDKNKFPLGLETIVGSKGAKLSGGQKQRIAIARALIKKPKILILDEATSALDSESEAKFQKELFNLKGKMTIIIVSHRLCTIKDCDEIVVINDGKIVEKGKHEELIGCRGIYHNLMEKQMENEK